MVQTSSPPSDPISSDNVNPVPTQAPHSIFTSEESAPPFSNLISKVDAEPAPNLYVA